MNTNQCINEAKYSTFSLTTEASEELNYACKRMGGLKKSAVVSYAITKLARELRKEEEEENY